MWGSNRTIQITNKNNNQELTLWYLTMIDPVTGWVEIKEIQNKDALNIANLVEQTWLTRFSKKRNAVLSVITSTIWEQ